MKNMYISVSVMCSDLMNLGADLDLLKQYGADWLHVDVMDAHFVPNLTFGPDFIKAMHARSDMPLDIHLMVTDPELVMERFELREGDCLTVHVELDRDFKALSDSVRARGCRFGLAVNPETPVDALEPHIGCFDTVTLMLVHPGYAGAKMVEGIMDKVGVTRKWLDSRGLQEVMISVDGSVSAERAALMAGMGAQIFVGGTAGIYRKGMELKDTIPTFRKAISL
ncbi:MAG: ribulose-phosphate 3-epimerase [Bacteroidales bacterium]|nr:ribulose-phosphate 3-epimerase [Bacteroidales bacterium]